MNQNGEQVVLYQRRALGSIGNNLRPPANLSPSGGFQRSGQQIGPSTPMPQPPPHYNRPHLFGHDINTMRKMYNINNEKI